MHYYSEVERKKQLEKLESELNKLIPIAKELNLNIVSNYEDALLKTRVLLTEGFEQPALSKLSRSVPDIIDRHRDWESQILEQKADGKWSFPDWFVKFDKIYQPASEAASVLGILGYY